MMNCCIQKQLSWDKTLTVEMLSNRTFYMKKKSCTVMLKKNKYFYNKLEYRIRSWSKRITNKTTLYSLKKYELAWYKLLFVYLSIIVFIHQE